MADAATFHGYAPDSGYEFFGEKNARKNDFTDRGCEIYPDEIFVSDEQSVILEISRKLCLIIKWRCAIRFTRFGVDSNDGGRTGYDPPTERWSDVIYMPCTEVKISLHRF